MPARRERVRRRAHAASWTSRPPLRGAKGHAVFLDCRDQHVRGSSRSTPNLPAWSCWSSTPRSRTRHADGGYRLPPRVLRAGRRGARRQSTARRRRGADLARSSGLLDDDHLYRRVRHVVTENDRVLQTVEVLGSQGPASIGPCWMRATFPCATTSRSPAPNWIWRWTPPAPAAPSAPRMTGGGFGGSAIALTPVGQEQQVRDAVVRSFCRRRLHRTGHLHGDSGGRRPPPGLTRPASGAGAGAGRKLGP